MATGVIDRPPFRMPNNRLQRISGRSSSHLQLRCGRWPLKLGVPKLTPLVLSSLKKTLADIKKCSGVEPASIPLPSLANAKRAEPRRIAAQAATGGIIM